MDSDADRLGDSTPPEDPQPPRSGHGDPPSDSRLVVRLDLAGMEALFRGLGDFQRIATELLRPALVDLQQLVAQQWNLLEPFRSLAPTIDRALPSNWPQKRWVEVFELVRDTGLPIIWVPSENITTALLDAAPADRDEVLVSHANEVCSSIRRVLDGVTDLHLKELADGGREATSAYQAGFPRAAQALTAVLLTTTINTTLGRTLAQAAKDFNSNPDDAPFVALRASLLLWCSAHSLARFFPEDGDPTPQSFNRHASVHRFDPVQFNDSNALVGLMLVTGLLREIQEQGTDGQSGDFSRRR